MFLVRKRVLNILRFTALFFLFYAFSQFYFTRTTKFVEDLELIIGEGSQLPARWVGTKNVNKDISILILAGHADSQGLAGAGTPGEAVDKFGLNPMDPGISDELFWNLKLQKSIVQLGKMKGLNISSYDPGIRNIDDANDPRTNWSVGKQFAKEGGYALEIHFDSYGHHGVGSGLIPPFFANSSPTDQLVLGSLTSSIFLIPGS